MNTYRISPATVMGTTLVAMVLAILVLYIASLISLRNHPQTPEYRGGNEGCLLDDSGHWVCVDAQ